MMTKCLPERFGKVCRSFSPTIIIAQFSLQKEKFIQILARFDSYLRRFELKKCCIWWRRHISHAPNRIFERGKHSDGLDRMIIFCWFFFKIYFVLLSMIYYKITEILRAWCLAVVCDLFGYRRTNDVTAWRESRTWSKFAGKDLLRLKTCRLLSCIKFNNVINVSFPERFNQGWLKVAHSPNGSWATFLFLPHFDVICDL